MDAYGYDGSALTIGARVEIHPATDLWMRGARFGTIVGIVPTPDDRVRVTMDAYPGRKSSAVRPTRSARFRDGAPLPPDSRPAHARWDRLQARRTRRDQPDSARRSRRCDERLGTMATSTHYGDGARGIGAYRVKGIITTVSRVPVSASAYQGSRAQEIAAAIGAASAGRHCGAWLEQEARGESHVYRGPVDCGCGWGDLCPLGANYVGDWHDAPECDSDPPR